MYIFDFDPKSALQYRSVFLWANILFLIFFICLFVGYNFLVPYFTNRFIAESTGIWLLPMILVILFACIFLCPFKIFWRSARICWVRTTFNILITPFGRCGFLECFMGDVYTSLVKTMFDMEYTICFFTTGDFLTVNDSTCDNVNNIMLPFFSVLPLFFRFLQCLKRYHMTRDKFQLGNALKYACGGSVVLFSTLMGNYQKYEPGYWPITRLLWIISFICSTLYMYCWDIFVDWGLGRVSSKHFFLRDKLVWGNHKWFYYYCIISNFFFRFFWTITISPVAYDLSMQTEMMNWFAASIEIVRRFTWAIVRVENEHLSNYEKFRVVEFIPLPFDVNETKDIQDVDLHSHSNSSMDNGIISTIPVEIPLDSNVFNRYGSSWPSRATPIDFPVSSSLIN